MTQDKLIGLEMATNTVLGGGRLLRHSSAPDSTQTKTQPAAFDEVFATLDRGNGQTQFHSFVGKHKTAINSEQIRSVADQLDRQRERLARLLREIELGASA